MLRLKAFHGPVLPADSGCELDGYGTTTRLSSEFCSRLSGAAVVRRLAVLDAMVSAVLQKVL